MSSGSGLGALGILPRVTRDALGWRRQAAGFAVALIPHTLAVTTLWRLEPGDEVNLEADVLGKVVERLLASRLA